MAKTKENPEKKGKSASDKIDELLKDKDIAKHHFNFVDATAYKVSSGSLKLDIELGGGFMPGIVRFSGITEGGKTSCALTVAKNFQETVENSCVVYFKAEGRLSQDMLARSGINMSENKFKIVKTNIYEVVGKIIISLINDNDENIKYLFIIDSMDSLNPESNMDKPFGDSGFAAGAAALSADFLKKMALPIGELGHLCIMISQVRAYVNPNSRSGFDSRVTNSSGGHAPLHYSDWILEFQQRTSKDDKIYEPSDTAQKGNPIGHLCKIIFRKSMNEKTGNKIEYPIKYGRKNGTSVWIEREVVDYFLMFGLATRKGAWITIDDAILKEAKEAGVELKSQHNGMESLYQYFEDNQPTTAFFYKKFRDTLQKSQT